MRKASEEPNQWKPTLATTAPTHLSWDTESLIYTLESTLTWFCYSIILIRIFFLNSRIHLHKKMLWLFLRTSPKIHQLFYGKYTIVSALRVLKSFTSKSSPCCFHQSCFFFLLPSLFLPSFSFFFLFLLMNGHELYPSERKHNHVINYMFLRKSPLRNPS